MPLTMLIGLLALSILAAADSTSEDSTSEDSTSEDSTSEDSTSEDSALVAALRVYNQAAHFPLPALSEARRSRLLAGEVVKIISQREDGTLQASGLLLSHQPRDAIWLACQDAHFASPGDVTEARLRKEGDRARWYGYIDLPRPLTDRHWVVDVWNNHALASSTDNICWEHLWELVPGSDPAVRQSIAEGRIGELTLSDYDTALYTPVNHGAWALISLPPDHTLIAYHATSVVGGNIPDRLVAELLRSGMEELLRRIERIAEQTVPEHYVAGHPPVRGGDGQPLPLY